MEKIEKIFFYVFLFLIPFQIKDVWHWGGSEWNSIFFYLCDALFILILICWLIRGFKGIQKEIKGFKGIVLLIFLLVAGLSLIASSNLEISVYRFVKLVEFGLLFLYIRSNLKFLRIKNILMVLIASGLVQAILAIAQFIKQSSLGLGILESGIFRPGIPGVATFSLGAEKIMRAYGSFQHPNVLAGFLLLVIFCFYGLFLKKKINLFYVSCFMLCVFALFLTFSRVALLVFLIMSLVMFLIMMLTRHQLRMKTNVLIKLFGVFLLSVIISTAILFPYLKARFFTISLEEEALNLRFFYNKMAWEMIKEKSLLGIGVGNFVAYSQNYPAYLRAASKMLGSDDIPDWLFQPVHNIYLLIGAEIGLIGLIIFLGFILIGLIRPITPITFLIIGFLILGLTDHYFWTLQSGALMFWIALALS